MNKFLKILNLKPFYRYKYTTIPTSHSQEQEPITHNPESILVYDPGLSRPDPNSLILPILPIEFNYKTCYICYDQITTNSYLRKLNCQHEFHKKCIDKWLFTQFKQSKNEFTCPLCRSCCVQAQTNSGTDVSLPT